MTDAAIPSASDVLNAPPPVATPESLTADPAFMARAKEGDVKAFDEYNRAWRISRGMSPEPVSTVNEIDVLTQMGDRAIAEFESRAESLRADGLSELAIYEYLNGRPVPLAEHQEAQRQLARLKSDKAFLQRLNDGNPDARREWRRVHLNISMPVVHNSTDGKLQPEIAAWEAAHKSRKPAA